MVGEAAMIASNGRGILHLRILPWWTLLTSAINEGAVRSNNEIIKVNYPCDRPSRSISVFPVRYRHHPHIKKQSYLCNRS
jgi:hypothetical protein